MNNILASFIFFTQLPFWKIKEVPAECFKHVVPYWPLTNQLTGGLMTGALWLSGQILPVSIAWIMVVTIRLLVTGCLHKDGLTDFVGGFGDGTTRERTLAIMKDSHIGNYGVIGLIFCLLLLLQMRNLPLNFLCILAFYGDYWPKFCASQLINYLPCIQKKEDSEARVVYDRMSRRELMSAFVYGLIPFILFLPIRIWPATLSPLLTFALLYRLVRHRLQGYTRDCCGATFLLCRLSFYIDSLIMVYIYAGYGIDFPTKYVSVPFYFH